jgi:undecaprenyl pyrophosphate phosphatase UppP
LQAVVLATVQGLTEVLPVSSSGHLAIVSRVFFSGDAGASFTAVTQLGNEAAVLVYFARDIGRIARAWFNGLFVAAHRDTVDYRMGWYVILGAAKCLARVPCVFRSGATISAGLFVGLDGEPAARFAFPLGTGMVAAT